MEDNTLHEIIDAENRKITAALELAWLAVSHQTDSEAFATETAAADNYRLNSIEQADAAQLAEHISFD